MSTRQPRRNNRRNKKVQKQPVQQKKQNFLQKNTKYPGSINKVIIPVVNNQNLRAAVSVVAQFDDNALGIACASIYAYLASKGIFNENISDKNYANVNAQGLGFMFQAASKMIVGGTDEVLTAAPEFMWDIITALKPKNVTLQTYSKAIYSWDAVQPFTVYNNINLGYGIWQPTICVLADNGLYNALAVNVVSNFNSDNYSQFIQKISSLAPTGKLIVRTDKYVSELANDVSAFARSYVYNGLQPSRAGGYYKDVENEVNITAPMLSAFAAYSDGTSDVRAPIKLTPYSGDASLSIGWPLHATFKSHYNKNPPVFKCIDFEWIYTTLTQWLSLAMTKSIALGQWAYGDQIQMSIQDFRIVLRQALLSIFDTQYLAQFTGPLEFSQNDNGFGPFMISGHSYGSAPFSQFLLPLLLKENLNALKARTVKLGVGKSKVNQTTYFPVLGRYVTDVPTVPIVVTPQGSYNLFISIPAQQTINLIDGSIAPDTFVNLNNSYYITKSQDYNFVVGKLTDVIAKTGPILGDGGAAGMGLLFYSSVCAAQEQTYRASAPVPLQMAQYCKTIANARTGTLERTNSKDKNVMALPPASVVTLTQEFTTMNIPIPSELQTFFDAMIVPEIRLDPNGNVDQLSVAMYQIEARECVSAVYANNPNLSGGGIFSRLSKLAQLCITGVGHDSAGEYDALLSKLVEMGKAGFLAGLLGGVAKMILPPDMHGIVDTVADLVPI